MPTRSPVAPDSLTSTPEGAAIAGWEHLVIWLSAGEAGLRTILVVLDESGRPISASDGVVYRRFNAAEGTVAWRHQNLGGRLEPDGTFLGTHWVSSSVEDADGTIHNQTQTPSAPTPADVARLKTLVDEVLRRASG